VEFCSVQKRGNTVRVEIRQSPLPEIKREKGDLIAPRVCRLESVVTLSGTILKKEGEELFQGESIVGGFFVNADGENKTPTFVVAKAKLLCIEEFQADTEEIAQSNAILYVESIGGELKGITVQATENGVKATAEFLLIIKKNM
jgi:hypothetical protein